MTRRVDKPTERYVKRPIVVTEQHEWRPSLTDGAPISRQGVERLRESLGIPAGMELKPPPTMVETSTVDMTDEEFGWVAPDDPVVVTVVVNDDSVPGEAERG